MFQLEPESFAFHNHKKQCLTLIRTDRGRGDDRSWGEYCICIYFSRFGTFNYMRSNFIKWKISHLMQVKYEGSNLVFGASICDDWFLKWKTDYVVLWKVYKRTFQSYFTPWLPSCLYRALYCTVLARGGSVACSLLRQNLRSRSRQSVTCLRQRWRK